ncbi:Cdc40 [Symbiodinium sp. CCMP2592]|nr:Cdc40 [Symbiodinium sp. CCMP2592]
MERRGKPPTLDDDGLRNSRRSERDDDDDLQRSQTEDRKGSRTSASSSAAAAAARPRVSSVSAPVKPPVAPSLGAPAVLAAPASPAASPTGSPAASPASLAGGAQRKLLDRAFLSTTMAWGNSKSQQGNKWSSTAGFKDSLTGQEVSRAQAMAEIAKLQKESAMRILNVLEGSIPSLEGDNFVRMALLEKLDMELDKSKQMLQQRCRELLGSDLAELRIQKTERKALLDKIDRINRQNTQEISALRSQVWDIPESSKSLVQRVLLEAQASPSTGELGREGQACMLATMEQKLVQVLSPNGSKDDGQVPKQPSRLENSFVQERVATLKQQMAALTEQVATTKRQISALVAAKEELTEELQSRRGERSSGPSSSASLASVSNRSRSPLHAPLALPKGRPNPKDPRRRMDTSSSASNDSRP